jgi:hypothetical protein
MEYFVVLVTSYFRHLLRSEGTLAGESRSSRPRAGAEAGGLNPLLSKMRSNQTRSGFKFEGMWFSSPSMGLGVAEQAYLAPLDHGAGSFCRSLHALALMFPPKLSSRMFHCVGAHPSSSVSGVKRRSSRNAAKAAAYGGSVAEGCAAARSHGPDSRHGMSATACRCEGAAERRLSEKRAGSRIGYGSDQRSSLSLFLSLCLSFSHFLFLSLSLSLSL